MDGFPCSTNRFLTQNVILTHFEWEGCLNVKRLTLQLLKGTPVQAPGVMGELVPNQRVALESRD